MSLLARFVALGGSSYAALRVGSKQIVNNSIRSKDIRDNTVASKDVKNRSLVPKDFKLGALPAGPRGLTGPTGPAGRSALTALKSGETIRGAWGVASASVGGALTGVTFPIPAPQPVDSRHVVAAFEDTVSGDGCTGSAAAPVAGRGFVCIYVGQSFGSSSEEGHGARSDLTSSVATGDGSPYGFAVLVNGSNPDMAADGTWAYRAP